MKQVPVLLLTGYLGSGKTTLVNHILSNKKGIKFAVMVNDIGEVNIDADLIQKGGIVGQKDESLVALQNGCICCTLKMDLVEQLNDIINQDRFDYIVIEASGICEPAPIAQTIYSMPTLLPEKIKKGFPWLDCIVTVVDALRLQSEFGCGDNLTKQNIGEDDLENLVIQQIEFCNIILLNKASMVSVEELGRIKHIIKAIQPKAQIIECDYCDVDLDNIINTDMFDFDEVATSAAWVSEVEKHHDEDDDLDMEDEAHDEHEHHHEHDHEHHHEHDHEHHHEHDHEHHHHHHHHHDEGEAEEYGIGTFVYYRRRPFDLGLFDDYVARKWPKNIIRAKGICYFKGEEEECQIFEQAGKQFSLTSAGKWYATMPKDEFTHFVEQNPGILQDWDETYGDRMQKLVFIGQHLDKAQITKDLDFCLAD